jgi:hypothetical protein
MNQAYDKVRPKSDLGKIVPYFLHKRNEGGLIFAFLSLVEKVRNTINTRYGIYLPLPFSCESPGQNNPAFEMTGLSQYEELKYLRAQLKLTVDEKAPRTINVLVPTLESRLIFGGYIALLNFLAALRARGVRLRIIICDNVPTLAQRGRIREQAKTHPLISKSIGDAPILFAHHDEKGVVAGPEDRFMSYSWTTSYFARQYAQRLNGKPFVFFAQEYEPIFYPHDSIRAMAEGAYSLPHNIIFNTEYLADYFRQQKLSVFAEGSEGRHATFTHSLSRIVAPNKDEIASRKTKRLLFYSRPEMHAGRNLFAIGIMSLQRSLEQGVFGNEWEFYGIGSMGTKKSVQLTNGIKLNLIPRMPLDEYEQTLKGYDLGLSLMYAPHPSVPPLEMAAAGMVVVTTTFSNRPVEVMEGISKNIIAVKPYPWTVSDGLARGVTQVEDFDGRVEGAQFSWPRNWEDSFTDRFMSEAEDVLS